MFFALEPHSPRSSISTPLGTGLQSLPFQCRMTPASPTDQTSLLLVPQTSLSCSRVPLGISDHWMPFQRTVTPSLPTAQMSSLPLPQIAFR